MSGGSWAEDIAYARKIDANWLIACLALNGHKYSLEWDWQPVHDHFREFADELLADGLVELIDYYHRDYPGCSFACKVTDEGHKYIEREEALRVLSK
jgi:hypothetical protein